MNELSSSGFQYNDYDNWNTNSNVSSHLCKQYIVTNLANRAKKYKHKKSFGTETGEDLLKAKKLKRHGNLYQEIISIENLMASDIIAQKGKGNQYGVKHHNKTRELNILNLHNLLLKNDYQTSTYDIFKVYEPKEREVYRLPYFPDRIMHHAIMRVLEPIFVSTFTADTYSCIKGRGIHSLLDKLKKDITDVEGTKYCLKLDITKFYPNVDHDILKFLLKRKFKDPELLGLLFEIIDSAPGLPIGNYLSQYLANFYLSYFDHWIKESLHVRYYYRYADDIVILSSNKQELHELLGKISYYLRMRLKLSVKPNYQIFPIASRGIDFVGYRLYHTHTLLRKRIKQNFARKIKKGAPVEVIASYRGWLKHADCLHLTKKLLPNEQF